MSAEALTSFVEVMQAVQKVALAAAGDEAEVVFDILEGSAVQVARFTDANDAAIREIDRALNGKSKNDELVKGLRTIQRQLKKSDFVYEFTQSNAQGKVIELHSRMISATRISLSRKRQPYELYPVVLTGILTDVGGLSPNYHLADENRELTAITCQKEEAIKINAALYQEVSVVTTCKHWDDEEKKREFRHLMLLRPEISKPLELILEEYINFDDLIEKLNYLYQAAEDILKTPAIASELLAALVVSFSDERLHQSELKTMLIISHPFRDVDYIQDVRPRLEVLYNGLKA